MSAIASAKVIEDGDEKRGVTSEASNNETLNGVEVGFILLVSVQPLSASVIFFSEVFPMQMEGVRLFVNKGLSNHFQVG